jgi:hypothetical protein
MSPMDKIMGAGWFVLMRDDASFGGKQHYLPNEGNVAECGQKLDGAIKRRAPKCKHCLKARGER